MKSYSVSIAVALCSNELVGQRLARQPGMDALGGVAAVTHCPHHQRGAAHDVAGGEHAVEIGHHALPVDFQRAPAGDAEIGRVERRRQVLGIEAQRLQHQVGLDVDVAVGDLLRHLAAGRIGHAEMDAHGAHVAHLLLA
jgi:hypothetical protein